MFLGYYRVKYDPKNYELIRDQLLASHTVISTNNRAQLLDDAFNLAILGMVSYASALDLTLYLGKERDYTPWEAVLPELDYIHSMFVNRGGNANWEVKCFLPHTWTKLASSLSYRAT